jgi:adenosylcobyric acid synthase
MGICGGYQMLGKHIFDPEHIESHVDEISGLGLLDFTTTLTLEKTLTQVNASMVLNGETSQLKGYEIHCGFSTGAALTEPLLHIQHDDEKSNQVRADGCVSSDNKIIATYLHGFFDCPEPTQAVLNWLGIQNLAQPVIDINQHREIQLERLAEICEQHLDMKKIKNIIEQGVETKSSRSAE